MAEWLRIPGFHRRGPGSVLGRGTEIPQATQRGQKNCPPHTKTPQNTTQCEVNFFDTPVPEAPGATTLILLEYPSRDSLCKNKRMLYVYTLIYISYINDVCYSFLPNVQCPHSTFSFSHTSGGRSVLCNGYTYSFDGF